MATTSIIVEILIIGFFASVWILLFSLRLGVVDLHALQTLSLKLDSTALVIIISAVSYQLGVIVNSMSYKITKPFSQLYYRNELVKGVSFEAIKARIQHEGSEDALRSMSLRLSFVRLMRAGIINFLLIAIGLFSFGGRMAVVGLIPLVVSMASVLAWRAAYQNYYKLVGYAYSAVTGQPVNDSLFRKKERFRSGARSPIDY